MERKKIVELKKHHNNSERKNSREGKANALGGYMNRYWCVLYFVQNKLEKEGNTKHYFYDNVQISKKKCKTRVLVPLMMYALKKHFLTNLSVYFVVISAHTVMGRRTRNSV